MGATLLDQGVAQFPGYGAQGCRRSCEGAALRIEEKVVEHDEAARRAHYLQHLIEDSLADDRAAICVRGRDVRDEAQVRGGDGGPGRSDARAAGQGLVRFPPGRPDPRNEHSGQ